LIVKGPTRALGACCSPEVGAPAGHCGFSTPQFWMKLWDVFLLKAPLST